MSTKNNKKVNYNLFAETFSASRSALKWEEIDYFINNYKSIFENKNILDVWCGSWRLLKSLSVFDDIKYTWIDASSEMIKQAQKEFLNNDFFVLDMEKLDSIGDNFDVVFFIASFHHLDTLEKRESVLNKLKNILKPWSYIFMTNWALNSKLNKDKYFDSIIKDSKNDFESLDYNIKIWNFYRYYHCFSLNELEFLFKKTWYEIIENRLFDNQKNIISIIKN